MEKWLVRVGDMLKFWDKEGSEDYLNFGGRGVF